MIGNILKKLCLITITIFLISCVSTINEPKKWKPRERAEVHVQLGLTYLRQNQYDTANMSFDSAIAINPQSDAAHHAKGLLMSRMGNQEDAEKFFARAVSLNPNNYLAVNDYAVHLCQNKNTHEGLALLKDIENQPSNNNIMIMQTMLGIGICYHRRGDYKSSSEYLRTVLDSMPELPQALLPMAEISYKDKKYLSARAFLERYFGAGALSENSLYLAANIENQLGDKNKANQYRRELKKRFPISHLNKKLDELLL